MYSNVHIRYLCTVLISTNNSPVLCLDFATSCISVHICVMNNPCQNGGTCVPLVILATPTTLALAIHHFQEGTVVSLIHVQSNGIEIYFVT